MKKAFETITQKQIQREKDTIKNNFKNNNSKADNITIDTEENKQNFLKILKNQNSKNENKKKENNRKIKSMDKTIKKELVFYNENKIEFENKTQSQFQNKLLSKPESIRNNSYNEIISKTERSFNGSNFPNEENVFSKNFHTMTNNNSKTNVHSNYFDSSLVNKNNESAFKKFYRTELFNYEIKNNETNKLPRLIDYSSGRSRSQSEDNQIKSDENFEKDFNEKNSISRKENNDYYSSIDNSNYNFCKEIFKCKKPNNYNKQINKPDYLNNFLNSSEEYADNNYNNNGNISKEKDNNYRINGNLNGQYEKEVDEKYNKINHLIASKNNPNANIDRKSLANRSHFKYNKNGKENVEQKETLNYNKNNSKAKTNFKKKEFFRHKNFNSKCLERSRSFSRSISAAKSRSVSAENNKSSNKHSKLSNFKNQETININNISNISETGKRSFSQCNKKVKEIASQRGIPKKTPIILNNLKINFIKFIKPTYTVVFCDKERIYKYRNKLIDPFNFGNNLKNEVASFENILKNSELYTNKKKRNSSVNKICNNIDISKRKNCKEAESSEKNKALFDNVATPKNKNKYSQKINKINLNNNFNSNEAKSGKEIELEKIRIKNDDILGSYKERNPNLRDVSQKKHTNFTQEEIIPWLEDLNIIKPNTICFEDLPAACSTGVLLADLINRLEGVIRFILIIF